MRTINKIILHWSGNFMATAKSMRDYHVNIRHYSDIGYHYVIERDGSIIAGRPLSKVGAHCRNHNSFSIGICVVADQKNRPTNVQLCKLRDLIVELDFRFGLSPDKDLYCHSDFAKTLCPGSDLRMFVSDFKCPF